MLQHRLPQHCRAATLLRRCRHSSLLVTQCRATVTHLHAVHLRHSSTAQQSLKHRLATSDHASHLQVTSRRSLATAHKDATPLLDATATGDISKVEELLQSKTFTVNDDDYDRRTALHIAAADGRKEVVEYLLQAGANVNAEDRWGNTPLDDALTCKKDESIRLLKQQGGVLGAARMAEIGNIICQAASEGNIQHLQRLHECGVDMNKTDYDGRAPLHIAAAEGHVSTVEWLIAHGATVNITDRFGNTPLSDASRSRARSRKQVCDLLLSHNAQMESQDWEIKQDPMVQSSIHRSLPFIAQRSGASYIEAYVPNSEESEFTLFDGSTYVAKEDAQRLQTFTSTPTDTTQSNTSSNILGKVWRSHEPVVLSDLTERDLPTRFMQAKQAGLRTGLVMPIVLKGKTFAILRLFSFHASNIEELKLREFTQFVSGIVTAGVYRSGKMPAFIEPDYAPKGQMAEVYGRIINEGVFNPNLVYHEVCWFYHMGIHHYYFERFSPSVIADHIHSFIAAKKLAATTGRPEDIMLNIESRAVDGSPSFLSMCPMEHSRMVEIEKRIAVEIKKIPSNRAYTQEFFLSEHPLLPGGQKPMCLYVLETSEWINQPPKRTGSQAGVAPVKKGAKPQLDEICSKTFAATKSAEVKVRYQAVVDAASTRLSPLAQAYPTHHDGTLPLMFAFVNPSAAVPGSSAPQAGKSSTSTAGSGQHQPSSSYMLQLTELLKYNGLVAGRKFLETFSNGVQVFSVYLLQPADTDKVESLLKQFSMLHLVADNMLTSRFMSGEYSAEQYTYHSSISRFIYYFLNKRSEEFDVLAKSMADNPMNLGRLRLLQTRLKREAVSLDRIYACLINHPTVASELFDDFHRSATTVSETPGQPRPVNTQLQQKIKNEAITVLDEQIMSAMATFNRHLLKANFHKRNKSSLSFRVHPGFLSESDWPVVPYGLFFVAGSDFQGFHLRFKDIARGGIRMIRSADRQSYNNNLETLFTENYGLAYTQNKKNKDIPEFGSKGTILLQVGQQNPALAFQKYVSGLLDLIVAEHRNEEDSEIVDNVGHTEILFLGPDEGTADYMEWAARYAERRKYPFWRSFTTGKPLSLGGIPHDKFGMTTRGVHRYVLNALAKMELREEDVTKFQTGGPDGDLGSNEILCSKDKTTGIVDGSGVISDPDGLNREELNRLAEKRVPVREFNPEKLGPRGFKVLVSDNNVTLPDGNVIESGLAFRNEFHLLPYAAADVFVPCGGRPESVNLTNVKRLIDAKTGKPHFRVVIEGANLFFTQDARMVMEEAGVLHYKDASTNKGGVTSSSLEVFAALAMDDDTFAANMAVTDESNIPPFYMQYVKEIHQRIENDADLEFECIWREAERTGMHKYLLTDQISDKINQLNDYIQSSNLWHNVELRRNVLSAAIPPALIEKLGLDAIIDRTPDAYLKAIFGAYLASRYVYSIGLQSNEIAFFNFLASYQPGAAAAIKQAEEAEQEHRRQQALQNPQSQPKQQIDSDSSSHQGTKKKRSATAA